MPRLRQQSRGRFSNRRRTGWEEGPGDFTVQAFTGSGAAFFLTGREALGDGLTIVRIRGLYELIVTSGAALSGFHGALGIGIVTADAFAVGITAMPSPVDDIDWEGWMYYSLFSMINPLAATANSQDNLVIRKEIDSKAMRKIGVNEIIFAGIEVTEVGASGLEARLATRMLVKLS